MNLFLSFFTGTTYSTPSRSWRISQTNKTQVQTTADKQSTWKERAQHRASPGTLHFGCTSTLGSCSSNMHCPCGWNPQKLSTIRIQQKTNRTLILPTARFLSFPLCSKGDRAFQRLCVNSASVRACPWNHMDLDNAGAEKQMYMKASQKPFLSKTGKEEAHHIQRCPHSRSRCVPTSVACDAEELMKLVLNLWFCRILLDWETSASRETSATAPIGLGLLGSMYMCNAT